MSPISSDKAELERVLDAINLFIAAKTSKPDAVIHLLGAVLVPDIEYDTLFSAVEQESGRARTSARDPNGVRDRDLLRGDIAHEELSAAATPPARGRVHFRDRGHAFAGARRGADCGYGVAEGVHPDVALGNQLLGLDAGAW